ncbi:MAG: hypothetical protein ACOX2F_03670 [bacterium]
MAKKNTFVLIVRNLLAVTFLFFVMYVVFFAFSFLEQKADCFPVTVITTEKEMVDELFSDINLCSLFVESERMTFDSSIFNHYELLPVKEIYLYSAEIPFAKWKDIKKIEDFIAETNPYVESVVEDYLSSKLKYHTIAFIVLFFIGLLILLKAVPSWKISKGKFKLLSLVTVALYGVFALFLFYWFQKELYFLMGAVLSLLLLTYLIALVVVWRLLKGSIDKKIGRFRSLFY